MKKAIKMIFLVLLFLAVAVGAVFGYRFLSGRQADAPLATEGQVYRTTSVGDSEEETDLAEEELDNLASDSSIDTTTAWPFADAKSESKFEAKESVGYTKKASTENKTKSATTQKENSKNSDNTTKEKSSDSSSGSAKSFLKKLQSDASSTKNGHPVTVDSDGISTEYKKFAVADLNGDGKEELFLFAESSKDGTFYGYSYIVYDSSMKNSRTSIVIDDFDNVKFYQTGAYEIVEGKFGFVSDEVAQSYGVKNKSSILGFDATATPYLKYMTNGPYIDSPSEISAADYKAQLSKLRAGGKLDVTVYDFTSANVNKL